MTVSHRSGTFTPRPRSDGPPGIDWTHAASDCPACWRIWLAGDLPRGPLLSRRTHAALAAATLALSSTAPAVVLASEPHHHRGQTSLHDSNPLDPVVETPGDDSPSAPVGGDPEPPALDPDGPGDGDSPAPEPVTQVPETAPDEQDDPVDAEADPPPVADGDPAPDAPVTSPEGGSSPPPPTADQSGPSDTAPASGINPRRSQLERHTLYIARSARSHRSSRISSRARTTAATAPRTVIRVAASGVATAVPRAGRAQPGDRSHVVRPGESLWSIASDALGGRASSARIAAEVRRLWQLNGQHIGSGDPDLLAVGTRLMLR
jgi:hypothetical protein